MLVTDAPKNGKAAMRLYAKPNNSFPFETEPRARPSSLLHWPIKLCGCCSMHRLGKYLLGLAWIYRREKVSVSAITRIQQMSRALVEYASVLLRRKDSSDERQIRFAGPYYMHFGPLDMYCWSILNTFYNCMLTKFMSVQLR